MFVTICAVLFSLAMEPVLGVTLEQKDFSITKEEGKSVYISCEVTGLSSSNYVHWYQQKEGEALTRILYVKSGSLKPVHDANFHEAQDFGVMTQSNNYALKIANLKKKHVAVYYCASWERVSGRTYYYKVFGSGTRLIVTEKAPTPPTLSMFPVSSRQRDGKHVLLCKAQGMFPNLVKFTWNDESGREVQPSQEGYDLLEQTDNEEVGITSMLIADKSKSSMLNKYKCTVKHEKNVKSISIPEDTKADKPQTCPPKNTPNEEQEDNLISVVYEHSRSLYLFSMTYVMLLVKNMLYFCIIFFLLYKRNSANKGMLKGKVR